MQGLALDPASWKKRGKPAAKGIATFSGVHVFVERDATLTSLTGTGFCVLPVSQNLALVSKVVEAWLTATQSNSCTWLLLTGACRPAWTKYRTVLLELTQLHKRHQAAAISSLWVFARLCVRRTLCPHKELTAEESAS